MEYSMGVSEVAHPSKLGISPQPGQEKALAFV